MRQTSGNFLFIKIGREKGGDMNKEMIKDLMSNMDMVKELDEYDKN